MSYIGERYREFMAASGGPEEARRRIVECARRHGTTAAARMSGASRRTALNLVTRADAGENLARNAGRQPLSARDEGRILAAKRAHPDEGAELFFKNRRVPYCYRTIFRVLHEAGMLKSIHVPTRDPDFWIRRHEKRRLFAQINFYLGMIARLKGYTGRIADTEGPLRRMRLSERKLERWRAKREGERSRRNAIITSAVPVPCVGQVAALASSALPSPHPLPGRPGTDPDPDRAGESGMTDSEMVATLAGLAELAASALERVLASTNTNMEPPMNPARSRRRSGV